MGHLSSPGGSHQLVLFFYRSCRIVLGLVDFPSISGPLPETNLLVGHGLVRVYPGAARSARLWMIYALSLLYIPR